MSAQDMVDVGRLREKLHIPDHESFYSHMMAIMAERDALKSNLNSIRSALRRLSEPMIGG